jgi:hypothetical protein
VTAAITLGWVIGLIVLLSVRSALPADVRWWVWTCACGATMGLFGLWYVPFLKRRRARMAAEHTVLAESPVLAEPTVLAESPVLAEPQAPGVQSSEPASGYVSRDNGSNTVSSTETPGKSTRS